MAAQFASLTRAYTPRMHCFDRQILTFLMSLYSEVSTRACKHATSTNPIVQLFALAGHVKQVFIADRQIDVSKIHVVQRTR
jgi:hypothetical protein